MELPLQQVSTENAKELSINELTSDVLRARTLEYYNSFPVQSSTIQKSGGIMHVNGYANRKNAAVKLVNSQDKYRQSTLLHAVENQILFPSHGRIIDRPQRTYSERTNRVSSSDFVIGTTMAVSRSTSLNKSDIRRSNSSLDLDQDDDGNNVLRRDFGSASSLDIISKRDNSNESFFIMLREYRNESLVQSNQTASNITDHPKSKSGSVLLTAQTTSNSEGSFKQSQCLHLDDSQSPKLKTKFQRLWDIKDRSKAKTKPVGSDQSIFKKLRGNKAEGVDNYSKATENIAEIETRIEEKLRKKAFSHYDCQSITANISYASRLCNLLSRRRNTTTGASAASMSNKSVHNKREDLHPEESDFGDGKSSSLVLSCPFFRNELGGENERMISLNRMTSKNQKSKEELAKCLSTLHKPIMACGLSILENNNSLRWKQLCCPYQKPSLNIENVDEGAFCYRKFCFNQEHQNWFGIDETLGPVAISIKREKIEHPCLTNSSSTISSGALSVHYQYRLIVRTSELTVLRGTISEEAIPSVSRTNTRGIHVREVLEYVVPELQLSSVRLGIPGPQTEEQVLKLDEQGVTKTYKVGIMYCKANQSTEEEMYNNEHSGPAFEEFLDMLGQRVRLKGFDKYRAGLDNKTDTTGLYSIYAAYQDCEIMFHVSTMLPYTPNNKQQLLRKRHIGNDIVTIVFQEPDSQPFTPKNIRSQFQHVFIIIRAINPCTEHCSYSIAVSRSKEVPVFGPPIIEGATFPKSKSFADYLIAKVINAENAAHRSEKFATMAQRTRQEYLKDLAANYSTNTTIDSGPKFSILSFGGKKKERARSRFIPDNYVQGAISWQVQVEDYGQSIIVDCFLGISCDTVVLIEESTYEVIFACPCNTIIGLSKLGSSLKLFYHQGECIVIYSKESDPEEIREIASRLLCVTNASETQELILRRNSLGQLGFHVQYEGIVTEVESYGFAWQAGLRQGSRLVEICKIAVATLTYDQIVDLLKTSMTVTVTVIPPFADGAPRRGCALHNCSYLSNSSLGDYENVGSYISECTPHKRSPLPNKKANALPQCQTSVKHEPHTTRTLNAREEDTSPVIGSRDNASSEHSVAEMKRGMNQVRSGSSPNVTTHDASVYGRYGQEFRHFSNTSPKHSAANIQSSFLNDIPLPTGKLDNCMNEYTISNSNSVLPHYHQNYHNHGRNTQSRLTHIGGMVSAHSELSLPELAPFHSRSHSHHTIISSSVTSAKNNSEVNNTSHSLVSQSCQLSSTQPSSSGANECTEPKSASPSLPRKSDCQSENEHHHSYNRDQTTTSGNSYCNVFSRHHQANCPLDASCDGSNLQSRSPRTSVRNPPESHSKLNRLRPGVTSVSNRPSKILSGLAVGGSSGSSCSGSTSTLQEDLLKLISPDFLDSDSNSEGHPSSAPSEIDSHTQQSTPYSSLERENEHVSAFRNTPELLHSGNRTPDSTLNPDHSPNDVILTKAHPAQVISSEPSSPCPTETTRLSREQRLSPRVTTDHLLNKLKPHPPPPVPSLIPLPESRNIDWPSLVDTATKAMETLPGSKSPWIDETHEAQESVNEKSSQVHELENTIWRLRQDLVKEQQQKANLEQKVRQLTEENQRLQAESQSTAAQLRRFTEWFFQNMEMHS